MRYDGLLPDSHGRSRIIGASSCNGLPPSLDHEAATREHVFVVHHFPQVTHRSAWDFCGKHSLRDLVLRQRLCPALDQLVDEREVGDARRACRNARIVLHVTQPHHVEDRAEVMIAGRIQDHVAVGGRTHVVSRDAKAAVSIAGTRRCRVAARVIHPEVRCERAICPSCMETSTTRPRPVRSRS